MATTKVEHLAVDIISASPWQTRRFPRKDPELNELATSISAVGVLQPILVRPADGGFEILAGERRLRASKIAGLTEIPAIVRDVDDDTAAELCVVENLQREDLGVIEEGHAIAMLLEREAWTVETVAAQIGRSPSWVARRSSLWTRLGPDWKKAATNPKHPAHDWPALRFEIIAQVDVESQSKILKKHSGAQGWFWHAGPSEVQREVDLWMHRLASAPFNTDDATLDEDAGPCVACPHRASLAHLLFDDVEEGVGIPKGDRCLLPSCWKTKTNAHFKAAFDAATEKIGKPPALVVGYNVEAFVKRLGKGLTTLQRWEIGKSKARKFKGAIAILVCDPLASHYGRLRWAKKTSSRNAATTRTKSIAEKRGDLQVKRAKDAIAAIVGEIRNAKTPPKARSIWAVHAIIDLSRGQIHNDADDVDMVAEISKATANAAGLNALAARLWEKSTIDDIDGALSWFWSGDQAEASIAAMTAIAEHAGVDAVPHIAAAIAENPEPESWTKKKTKKKGAKKKAAKKKITKKRATKKASS